MSTIQLTRCFNHHHREASAKCPACSKFYCRECVTEHDEKILCTSCLRQAVQTPFPKKKDRSDWLILILFPCSFVILWYLFFLVGRIMAAVPNRLHGW